MEAAPLPPLAVDDLRCRLLDAIELKDADVDEVWEELGGDEVPLSTLEGIADRAAQRTRIEPRGAEQKGENSALVGPEGEEYLRRRLSTPRSIDEIEDE